MLVKFPTGAGAAEETPPDRPSSPPAQEDPRDRATGTFLACLNHEIRTPLSGIIGMVDLLLETRLDDEQRDYLQAARVCTESLAELLNTTLAYAALEAGHIAVDEAEFSVREMLESVVAPHRAKAQAKNLPLSVTLDSKLPETLIGDAHRVKELLGYLVANAVKFTHSGWVEVHAALKSCDDTDFLAVEVRDTGIGIPPEQVERIWESFRSGESGLSRNYPGLGLGLAVARKLAALLAGSVHVVSDVGVGSVFTVEIPVGRPAAAVVNVSAQGAGDAVSAGPAILAVDDNPVGLKVLQRMLTRQHLHADCVGSSKEALEAAASRHYELVLMDLQMPEMDGLTAAAQMREIPGYESVPIIAVTAISSDQVREMCRNHGMQGFLSKPFEEEELAAIISRYLKPPQRS